MKKINLKSNNTLRDIRTNCNCATGCYCDAQTTSRANQNVIWSAKNQVTAFDGITGTSL